MTPINTNNSQPLVTTEQENNMNRPIGPLCAFATFVTSMVYEQPVTTSLICASAAEDLGLAIDKCLEARIITPENSKQLYSSYFKTLVFIL